jgi:hypothetical protein
VVRAASLVLALAVAGLDSVAIDTAARQLPRLHSLLVSQHGQLMFERYYNGRRVDQPPTSSRPRRA